MSKSSRTGGRAAPEEVSAMHHCTVLAFSRQYYIPRRANQSPGRHRKRTIPHIMGVPAAFGLRTACAMVDFSVLWKSSASTAFCFRATPAMNRGPAGARPRGSIGQP